MLFGGCTSSSGENLRTKKSNFNLARGNSAGRVVGCRPKPKPTGFRDTKSQIPGNVAGSNAAKPLKIRPAGPLSLKLQNQKLIGLAATAAW